MADQKQPSLDAKMLHMLVYAITVLVSFQGAPVSAQCDGSTLRIDNAATPQGESEKLYDCTPSGTSAAQSCKLMCQRGYYVKGTDPPKNSLTDSIAEVNCNVQSGSTSNGPWWLQLSARCESTEVPNSDKSATDSIEGFTGDESTITCDMGYSGGGTVTCQSDGTFTSVSCTPNPCASTQVMWSDKSTVDSITGATGDVRTVNCLVGYRDAGDRLTTICQSDGTFSPVRCTAEECVPTGGLPHSDKAGAGSIVGRTAIEVEVACDPGYSTPLDLISDPEPFRFRFQINPEIPAVSAYRSPPPPRAGSD
jgi:hypothetical protein